MSETEQVEAEATSSNEYDEIDAYLDEWEESVGSESDETSTDGEQDWDQFFDEAKTDEEKQAEQAEQLDETERQKLERLEREATYRAEHEELNTAVETVKGELKDLDVQLPDDLLAEHLIMRYAQNWKMRRAFEQRGEDQYGARDWQTEIKKAAGELREKLEALPDPRLTADREAVTAAVMAARTAPTQGKEFPSEKQLNSMSDREFEHLKRQVTR